MLIVGGKNLYLRDVKKIENTKSKEVNLTQKKVINPNETVSKGAIESPTTVANWENIKMDRELKQKLQN